MVEEQIICPTCGHPNAAEASFCQKDGTPLTEGDPSDDPLVGRLVGNYRLIKRVGEGGFGVVYRAEHRDLGTEYAIKILHPQFSANKQASERFRREALAAGRLRHEHVVHIADFGYSKGIGNYYAMEFLEGRTLKESIDIGDPFPPSRIQNIARQITSAMDHVHNLQIIHRDLKPENIFLINKDDDPDYVKLVDFGIAKILNDKSVSITRTGLSVGTPLYMSPEQARGKLKQLDHRTDIYSWGIILFEMMTGHPPFFSEVPHEVVMLHVRSIPPRLSEMNPDKQYSPELEALFRRLIAKKASERPNSMLETFQMLEKALSEPDAIIDLGNLNKVSSKHKKIRQTAVHIKSSKALLDTDLSLVSNTGEQISAIQKKASALVKENIAKRDSKSESSDWRDSFQESNPEAASASSLSEQVEENDTLSIIPNAKGNSFLSPPLVEKASSLSYPVHQEIGSSPYSSPEETHPDLEDELMDGLLDGPSEEDMDMEPTTKFTLDPLMLEYIKSSKSNDPQAPTEEEIEEQVVSTPETKRTNSFFAEKFSTNAAAFNSPLRKWGSIFAIVGFFAIVAFVLWPDAKPNVLNGPSLQEINKLMKQQKDSYRAKTKLKVIHLPSRAYVPPRNQGKKRNFTPKKKLAPKVQPQKHRPLRRVEEKSKPIKKSAVYTLLLKSRPEAVCIVNGKRFGLTPCKIHLKTGTRFRVLLKRKGYSSKHLRGRLTTDTQKLFILKKKRNRKPNKRNTKRTLGENLYDKQNPFKNP